MYVLEELRRLGEKDKELDEHTSQKIKGLWDANSNLELAMNTKLYALDLSIQDFKTIQKKIQGFEDSVASMRKIIFSAVVTGIVGLIVWAIQSFSVSTEYKRINFYLKDREEQVAGQLKNKSNPAPTDRAVP